MNGNEDVSVHEGPPVRCLVAIVDIRGFSEFAQAENDPTGTARFAAAVMRYTLSRFSTSRQLDDTHIKLLGDGVMVVLNLDDASQSGMANRAIVMLNELVELAEKFRFYLEVQSIGGLSSAPDRLGIGVAFGPIVRLTTRLRKPHLEMDDHVGHTINLAARLQEIARSGGCVVHADVFEKIFKKSRSSASFLELFPQKVEVRLRNIGGADDATVFTTAEIPLEYLKSKADERILDEFERKAMAELRTTFSRRRTQESHLRQLPQDTRFVPFRREGSAFREGTPYLMGHPAPSKTVVSIPIAELGVNPIADAVLNREAILVSYSVKYDECDEDDLNNEYWRQTKKRFPKARVENLLKLESHPTSILAVPILDRQTNEVDFVVIFDSSETEVFNLGIAEEMAIKLPILYEQHYGRPEEIEPTGNVEL